MLYAVDLLLARLAAHRRSYSYGMARPSMSLSFSCRQEVQGMAQRPRLSSGVSCNTCAWQPGTNGRAMGHYTGGAPAQRR